MTEARAGHVATLLPNGDVLLSGGGALDDQQLFQCLASSERFVPTSMTFVADATLTEGRFGHTALLLYDDSVLVAGGFTLLTAINLMLFSLIHNPCSTTIYTIYKETGSKYWAAISALLPLLLGFAVTFLVAQLWRIFIGPG